MEMILSHGFRAGLTLYPNTKVSYARAVDMVEMHGPERIYVNSACDWGHSVTVAIPQFIREMRRRGHTEEMISKIVFENPIKFMRQSPKFRAPAQEEKAAVLVA